ncbi:MAG: hypothetical protein ACPGOY_09725 [Rhodospirillaceae bacterium]
MFADGGPPQLGTTYFEPDGVSPGQPTGTVVGQRASQFRQELTLLQETIRQQNAQLQALRNKTIQDSNGYHENVAAMRARLQVGTTPSNPILMNRWEAAQGQLNTINDDIVLMNQLAGMISVNQGTTAYLLDSVRSSFAMPGAVDEDHRQLRVLEDETQQTSVLVDRLLSELGADIRRQQAYVNIEKSNLSGLAVAIRNGQLFGSNALSANPSGFGTTGAQAAFRGGVGPQYASVAPVPATVGNRPLVVIRFERADIPFRDPLGQAVNAARAGNPNVTFDVVAVTPANAGGANLSTGASRRNTDRVLRTMAEFGVSTDRMNVSAINSPVAAVNEVHIYAR